MSAGRSQYPLKDTDEVEVRTTYMERDPSCQILREDLSLSGRVLLDSLGSVA